MESINMVEELSRYNLEEKWNDYIGVQKEVLKVLRKEAFFANNDIINRKTGIHIMINAKGIKETVGAGKRFQALPKTLKKYKIATLRHLKKIIESAELIADNIENYHDVSGDTYAYLRNELIIDGEVVSIRISIRKKVTSNWFWIHNIDEKKKVPNYSTHP
ncbi:MAG: hypothetical protein E7299_02405 [Lachnospiraceae bacterium]|nr:hypothetical protein [Lachnospiraceae bacterium]